MIQYRHELVILEAEDETGIWYVPGSEKRSVYSLLWSICNSDGVTDLADADIDIKK